MSLLAVVTVFGWVGAAAGILAYGMVSKGYWGAGSFAFQLTNLGAATAMLLVAAANGVWPSAAANFAWIAIGAHSTLVIWRKRAAERARARTAPDALDLAA
ncbi:hypothetical protein [Xylanimonas ulmi]|uniref:CBU-0592-like domain-containing protein n=1 Tax=Xylanimonas ulmi TaxID=228973 RepID=A0A4Q7M5J0_9MICO|nr:hypothetical protein [Xylanibacterium ulmi]RZS62701.1 hypothetical protein EV386_3048 [Xylanibacterium ulmi]